MIRSMSRRNFLRLGAGLGAGILIVGCVPATPQGGAAEGDEAQQQITMLYWDDFEGPMQAEAFMTENPGVKIELIPYAGEESKLDSMIAAGQPPDVFVLSANNLVRYYEDGNLLDFQPMIDAEGFDLSIYFPEVLAAPRQADGGLYGLGPDFGAELFYYNTGLLDAAGLPHPDENWTWQEMQETAAALTQGDGTSKQYGIMPFDPAPPQMSLVWQNGGQVFSEDGKSCLMDSPEAIEALDYMADFVRNGYAPTPQQLSGMGMDRGQLFATGRVGLMSMGHWAIIFFEDNDDLQWNVTVLPKNKEQATFLYQAIWSASSKSEEPQLAWDFIKYSCSPEWSEKFVIEIGGQSSVIEVAERLATNPPATAGEGLAKVWNAVYKATPGAISISNIRDYNEVLDTAWAPGMDKLWSGELTAEQAGQSIATTANQILQR